MFVQWFTADTTLRDMRYAILVHIGQKILMDDERATRYLEYWSDTGNVAVRVQSAVYESIKKILINFFLYSQAKISRIKW